jgi:hypothetical protein
LLLVSESSACPALGLFSRAVFVVTLNQEYGQLLRRIMAKSESEPLEFTALVQRPQHLQAIGMLTVEITHMERAVSELFGTIMGVHFFLGEAIYFTVNFAIARMDIVRNAAQMVLVSLT